MLVDYIKFPYIGTMRDFDGSLFDVAWAFVGDDAATLDLPTPFRSGRNDAYSPFDTGAIGEIPEFAARRSRARIPARVCHDCRCGDDEWWVNGWPVGTAPVALAPDEWPTCCSGGPMPSVTSVGLAMPPEFIVTGSPVTSIGVLSADWTPEMPNTVLAAPDGAVGTPSFRALVPADIPDLDASWIVSGVFPVARLGIGIPSAANYLRGDGVWSAPPAGTVTSVGASVPSWMTISGSPVTSSGTIALDTASAAANRVLATPDGSAGQLSVRALTAADIPALPASIITSGTFAVGLIPSLPASILTSGVIATARLGSGAASSSTFLRGDQTWAAAGAGTVTSVGASVPSWMTISGSPVTSSGTIALDTASAAANRVLASPDGSAGTLSPRALVGADIPGLPGSKITSGGLDAAYVDTGTLPLAVIPVLTSAQLPTGSAVGTLTHFTPTTTAVQTAVFTVTNSRGLHGSCSVKLTSGGGYRYLWKITDVYGTTFTGTLQTGPNLTSITANMDSPTSFTGISSTVSAPLTTVELDVIDPSVGGSGVLNIYLSLVG